MIEETSTGANLEWVIRVGGEISHLEISHHA
jgi:hypothetical protein